MSSSLSAPSATNTTCGGAFFSAATATVNEVDPGG